MSKLTHFNDQGAAHMVDIGDKPITRRLAIASGSIIMEKETISLIKEKKHKKGDVLGIAQAAGIMAAKPWHASYSPQLPREALGFQSRIGYQHMGPIDGYVIHR